MTHEKRLGIVLKNLNKLKTLNIRLFYAFKNRIIYEA